MSLRADDLFAEHQRFNDLCLHSRTIKYWGDDKMGVKIPFSMILHLSNHLDFCVRFAIVPQNFEACAYNDRPNADMGNDMFDEPSGAQPISIRAPRKIPSSNRYANQIQTSQALNVGVWRGTAWFLRFESTL
nr:hypothetical protein [Methylocystis sp. H62]